MQLTEKMVRPNLPIHYYKPELKKFFLYLLFCCSFIFVFGYLNYVTVTSDLSLWWKVPLVSVLTLVAGHSFHLFGWIAHDGIHLSLLKNKYTSLIVGMFFGAAAFFPTVGYGITHWNHHRYTNQESDPDTKIYSRYNTLWERVLLARTVANRGYYKNTFLLAMNHSFERGYRLPFSDKETRWFAILNLVLLGMWLGIYSYITYLNLTVALFVIILPYVVNYTISGLRIYLEHSDTKGGIFLDSRSYSDRFYTWILFGNNFHLEHHLYPKVPGYKLPLVHQFLKEQGVFEKWGSPVESGIFAPLKYVLPKYKYPQSLVEDAIADPFDINNRPRNLELRNQNSELRSNIG